MKAMERTLVACAVSAAAMLAASAASATDYGVSNAGFTGYTSGVNLSGTINGNPFNETNVYTGLIPLTTTTNAIIPVFCVDLFHSINIGSYDPALSYTTGLLSFDSSKDPAGTGGNSISQPVTGEIQTLANLGAQLYIGGTGSAFDYAALQCAIWSIEYNTNGNSLTVDGGATLNAQIAADIAFAEANPASYANTLFPGGDGQAFGTGQAFTEAPGPKVGEGLLGFAAMTALLIAVRYRGLIV